MPRFSPRCRAIAGYLTSGLLLAPVAGNAQAPADSVRTRADSLATVRVTARPHDARLPSLPNVSPTAIRFGKRTEAIRLDRVDANLALNNTRQALGRAPGVNIWEQDVSGVQASIGVRGLSPNRSWEFNTRQDGVDIAADPSGYPEAYYAPPFEGVERIELVRGAASLQYGSQLGGLLNYVMKAGPTDRPFAFETTQRGGTGGLWSTYTAAGGQVGRLNWYAFGSGRTGDGVRRFGDFRQSTFGGRASLALRDGTSLTASVSRMDYTLRQPGGRTEAQFADDPWGSGRPRDWFSAPWLVPQLTLSHQVGAHSTLTVSAFGLYGERNSLGVISGPAVADTGLNPRRLDRDAYRNAGLEARLVHGTTVAARPLTLAIGLRGTTARTSRMSARGTDGESYRLDETAARTRDLAFDTRGAAVFAEAGLEVARGVVVSPGVRLETIRMTGAGGWTPASGTTFLATGPVVAFDDTRDQTVALGGLGLSVTRWPGAELYANATQSFRPATFAELFPTSLVGVDPALGPARGLSTDIGLRSSAAGLLTYDVSLFWLQYDDRIGTVSGAALGADSAQFPAGVVRNVGRSEHYGAEAFAELDVTRALRAPASAGAFAWWTSLGRTEARYVGGALDGNRVEYAPRWIARSGLTWRRGGASATVQGSYVDGTFSDASNTAFRADGLQGWIPAYRVVDATVRLPVWASLAFEASVNNLTGARYFTRRAGGYPGPGIIPADGRVVVAGFRWSPR